MPHRTGRTALAGVLGVAAALLPAAPALADSPCSNPDPPPWCVEGTVPGDPGGGSGSGSGGGSRAPRPVAFDVASQASPGSPNGRCWAIVATDPPGLSWAQAAAMLETFVGVPAVEGDPYDFDACPDLAVDPETLARDFWLATDIDPPAPVADPGRAVVGLKTYLEVGGPDAVSVTDPDGIVSLSGTPTYTIDWGDGTITETTSRGVPYPGGPGEITHVYTDAATVTITVAATWTGTWSVTLPSAGTTTGALPAVTRTSTVTMPVDQVQAVRDS